MKLKPSNAGKLASLSALGAGALVASMGEADASIIYKSLASATVGFDSGFGPGPVNSQASVLGSPGFSFVRSGTTGTSQVGNQKILFAGLGGVNFATSAGEVLRRFGAGATIGAASVNGVGSVAARTWSRQFQSSIPGYTYNVHHATPGSFSGQFALFTFTFNLQTYYGWVELSLKNVDGFPPTGSGPDLTVFGWAFDTTPGEVIPAGDTGTGVPEPGTFAMTGLAALALGAVGVRRWRAARLAKTA